MSFNPLPWGAQVLKAAVDIKLKSAVRSALILFVSFIVVLLSPMVTEEYYARPIVLFLGVILLFAEGVNAIYRSWFYLELN